MTSTEQFYVGNFAYSDEVGSIVYLARHLVGVDTRSGTIIHLSPLSSSASQRILQSCRGDVHWLPEYSFVVPTFVDTHLHAPQYLFAGTGQGLPLLDWLETHTFKAEASLDADLELAERVYATLCRRLKQNGTGTALCFGTIREETNLVLARCFHKAGLRGLVGKLSMHQNAPDYYRETDASSSLQRATAFLSSFPRFAATLPARQHTQRLVHPVITPRFIPTCSLELLSRLAHLSASTSPPTLIQSHMSESADSMAFIRSRHGGRSDPNLYDQAGLLTPHTVMAHCTTLPPEHRDLVRSRGTGIASCPLSNAFFSDAPFELREAIEHGLKVGLGSDIAGGYALSIHDAARTAEVVSRVYDQVEVKHESRSPTSEQGAAHHTDNTTSTNSGDSGGKTVTWQTTFHLATTGGARMLTPPLPANLGLFQVGAPFDAQLILTLDPATGQGWQDGGVDFFPTRNPTPNAPTESGKEGERGEWKDEWSWDLEEAVERWWRNGSRGNRRGVWVAAEWVGEEAM
ncbi:hypothetical protein ACQY0O_006222 [Thecaphora frezii]